MHMENLDRFGPCQIILDHFYTLDHFGPFWTILDRLDRFGPFGPFWTVWTILDHFGPKWPNMAKYAKYAYLGAYLGARNMVKWGVPENILQNAVQTHWS